MVTIRQKSVVAEAREVQLAIQLINLGVRLQMVESEVSLSRERLLRLYKELRGVSPPKGMLPFSADWFITWQPNIHASLFAEIHRCMLQHGGLSGVDALVTAYKLYLEQVRPREGTEAVLSLTRAWTLLRFMDGGLLATTSCRKCGGRFVVHAHLPRRQYVCGLCHMPSRAGKTRKGTESASGAAAEA